MIEWLDAFLYACVHVNNNLTSIPPWWKPAVPEWYDNWLSTLPPPPPTPSVTANSTAPAPYPPSTASKGLSTAAVGGIASACTIVPILFIILVVSHMKVRKKAKRKSTQVAVLQDQLSPHGFTNRINQLCNVNDDSFGGTKREPEPITTRQPVATRGSGNVHEMSPLAHRDEQVPDLRHREDKVEHEYGEYHATQQHETPAYGQVQSPTKVPHRPSLSEHRRPSSLYEAEDRTTIKPLPYIPNAQPNNYADTRLSRATTQIPATPYTYPTSPWLRDANTNYQNFSNAPRSGFSAESAASNPYHYASPKKRSLSGSRSINQTPLSGSDAYSNLSASAQQKMGESVSRTASTQRQMGDGFSRSSSAQRRMGEGVGRSRSAGVQQVDDERMEERSVRKVRDWL